MTVGMRLQAAWDSLQWMSILLQISSVAFFCTNLLYMLKALVVIHIGIDGNTIVATITMIAKALTETVGS